MPAIPIVALNLAFPIGGTEPFVFSAFIAIPLLAAVVLWLVPARVPRAADRRRPLRAARARRLRRPERRSAATSPGSERCSPARCSRSCSGRAGGCGRSPSRSRCSTGSSSPRSATSRKAAGDPSTERAFYEPLLAELDRLAAGERPFRVEVPPTKNRWEADYVAREYPLARGWLRQLESDDFDLFTDGNLDADAYRDWLDATRSATSPSPMRRCDYLAEDEVALIDSGLDYLDEVWSDDDWRLYRVADPARARGRGDRRRLVRGRRRARPARDRPRSTSTPLWSVTAGEACVSEGADDETEVERGRGAERSRSRRGSAGIRLGIVLGLASSVAWGVSDFLGGLQSRRISALSVLLGEPAGRPRARARGRADRRRQRLSARRRAARRCSRGDRGARARRVLPRDGARLGERRGDDRRARGARPGGRAG